MTRGRLLIGSLTVAALAVAGMYRYTVLEERDQEIIAAIAPVMLGIVGTGVKVTRGVDVAISGLPLHVRAQIRQLFGILRFAPSRVLLAGVWSPWHRASAQEIHGCR